jgi:hypothetical protein
MKRLNLLVPCLLALAVVGGCAKTEVLERHAYTGPNLPRPAHIIVHDFAATRQDMPIESGYHHLIAEHPTPQTPEQIALGRKLGAEIAQDLVTEIQDMGLPAINARNMLAPQVGDLVLKGYLISFEKGSATKRILIGFGEGGAEMRTAVEGFWMTDKGLRPLGSGEVESEPGKTPGVLLGAAVFAASANPVGLVVGTAAKAYEQESGKATIEGAAKRTAKEIADQLRVKFQQEGWI